MPKTPRRRSKSPLRAGLASPGSSAKIHRPQRKHTKGPLPGSMPMMPAAYAGVRSFAGAGNRSFSDGANPFRVYYPVDTKPRFSSRASFYAVGPLSTLRAYLHVFFGPFFPSLRAPPSFRNPWCGELHASMRHPTVGGWLWQWLAPLLLWPIAVIMWLLSAVPETVVDAPARPGANPLLVFSHGLIGSGEEQSATFAALARQGITVFAITHKDGSAAMTRYPNGNGGTVLGHYELPPNQLGEAYPPDYRVNQIEQRADEVQGLLHLLCPTHPSAKRTANQLKSFEFLTPDERAAVEAKEAEVRRELGDILDAVDFDKTVLGGFSYGAATTALVAARTGGAGVRGVFLLDGWYNVDLAEIRTCPSNEQLPFPPLAHERGLEPPALFIGSEMFAGFKHLNRRTLELQRKCRGGAEVHVFPGTVHWSFIDYWAVQIPTLSQWIGFLGPADLRAVHEKTLALAGDFVERVCA